MKPFARHLSRFLLLGSLTFISTSAFAQEAVILYGELEHKPGRVTKTVSHYEKPRGKLHMVSGEQKYNGKTTTNGTIIKLKEELEGGKVRLLVVEKQTVMTADFGNGIKKTDHKGPLVGIPLIGEKKDGKWVYQLEAGKPTEEQQKEIDRLALTDNIEIEFYPDRAVTIGETWTLSQNVIEYLLGDCTTDAEGTATMKLKDIVQYAGQRCALLEFNFECSGSKITDDRSERYVFTSKGVSYRSLDMFADMKIDATGNTRLVSSSQDGEKAIMGGSTTYTFTTTFE